MKIYNDIAQGSSEWHALRETIIANPHLADGDNCTLKRLKDAIGFELPQLVSPF